MTFLGLFSRKNRSKRGAGPSVIEATSVNNDDESSDASVHSQVHEPASNKPVKQNSTRVRKKSTNNRDAPSAIEPPPGLLDDSIFAASPPEHVEPPRQSSNTINRRPSISALTFDSEVASNPSAPIPHVEPPRQSSDTINRRPSISTLTFDSDVVSNPRAPLIPRQPPQQQPLLEALRYVNYNATGDTMQETSVHDALSTAFKTGKPIFAHLGRFLRFTSTHA